VLSVEDARARILADLRPTAPETVGLAAAWGRVSAAPVLARLTQPPSDVSAMDGYALRAADGAPGAVLTVIGSAPAGHPFAGSVGPGQAVRLFTGSVIPDGADGVLIQEDAARDGERLTVGETVIAGRHIRRAGQDFAAGQEVVGAGRRLGVRDIGLAAAANHAWLADFWKIAMRPGKPLVFGQLGAVPMLGLPGNPVSAIVCATLFLLPALARLSGLPGAPPAVVPGIAGADLAANDGRADHLRATLHVDEAGQLVATPFPVQDSAMLRRLARADALVLRAPRAHAVAAGAPIAMIRLDTLGI
jgi:molybdopterin molybdotransferase